MTRSRGASASDAGQADPPSAALRAEGGSVASTSAGTGGGGGGAAGISTRGRGASGARLPSARSGRAVSEPSGSAAATAAARAGSSAPRRRRDRCRAPAADRQRSRRPAPSRRSRAAGAVPAGAAARAATRIHLVPRIPPVVRTANGCAGRSLYAAPRAGGHAARSGAARLRSAAGLAPTGSPPLPGPRESLPEVASRCPSSSVAVELGQPLHEPCR